MAEVQSPEVTGKGDEFENMQPGTIVPLDVGTLARPRIVEFKVYPAGVLHFRQFSVAIARTLSSFSRIELKRDSETKKISPASLQAMLPALMEVILTDLTELIIECVKPNPSKAPHWIMPRLLEAWLVENFGEAHKVRPWVEAVELVIWKITGEKVPLWETFSKALSPQGIRDLISSIKSNVIVGAENSPTGGGPSPNSTTPPGLVPVGPYASEPTP
jgi:hypothetical protein